MRPTRRSAADAGGVKAEAAAAAEAMADRARRLSKRRQSDNDQPSPSPAKRPKMEEEESDDDMISIQQEQLKVQKPRRKRGPNKPKSLVEEVEFSHEFASARSNSSTEELNPQSADSIEWFANLNKLQGYKATTGHASVPWKYEADPALGAWVRTQRKKYATRTMPQYRQQALEALGFDWRLKESNSIWASSRVPDPVVVMPPPTPVARVVVPIAARPVIPGQTTDGAPPSPDRSVAHSVVVRAAPSTPRTPRTSLSKSLKWDLHFEKLKEYHALYGDWNVPMKFPENQTFSNWVRTQRDNFNYDSRAPVPQDRVDKLNSIGFDWKTPKTRLPPKTFEQMIKDLASYQTRTGNMGCLHPNKTVLGQWLDAQRTAYHNNELNPDQIEALENRGMEWTTPIAAPKTPAAKTKKWEDQMLSLKEFKEANGHILPGEDNLSLRGWLNYQRTAYHSNRMTPEQIAQLEEIGYEWGSPPVNATQAGKKKKFEERMTTLKDFHAVNGHVNVGGDTKENNSLRGWLVYQRMVYHADKMTPDQIAQLEELGFDWGVPPPKKRTWDELYGALGQFMEEKGHTNVPFTYGQDMELGKWVAKQRALYLKETLEETKVQKLEAIGFDWSKTVAPTQRTWEQDLESMKAYRVATGNSFPTALYAKHPTLCLWACRQRVAYHKQTLDAEKIAALDALEFDWNGPRRYKYSKEEVWYAHFCKLRAFQEEHGHCGSIDLFPEDSGLMDWMSRQHVLYLKRKLTEEQIAQLESIGFAWRFDIEIDDDGSNSDDDKKMPARTSLGGENASRREPRISWEKQRDYLLTFKALYDSWNVPPAYDPKLSQWVKVQRKAYQKGKGITAKKVEILNEIGFFWDQDQPMYEGLVEKREGLVEEAQATVIADNSPMVPGTVDVMATPLTPLFQAAEAARNAEGDSGVATESVGVTASAVATAAAAAARGTTITNLQSSPLAASAITATPAVAAAAAAMHAPGLQGHSATLHSAAAKAAAASSRALLEAKKHRMRLQSELNQCRLSLHHLDKTNQGLKKQIEEGDGTRAEENQAMQNRLKGHEDELRAQQQTIVSQTQQLTQLFQQVQEMRQAQTVLLQNSHQQQDPLQQQQQQYNFSYRL